MSKSHKEMAPLLHLEKEERFDLWQEHSRALKSWDDLSLARWLNQTLGQLHERCWRASHPLVVAYRLGTTVAHQRDLWNRRSFSSNPNYPSAACCCAPAIPFVSFEVCTHGVYCSCCGEVLLTIEEFPANLAAPFQVWSKDYQVQHQVAHRTDLERKKCGDYDKALDQACERATPLLAYLGYVLAPRLLEIYPAVLWEDTDHCLDIIPEDIFAPKEED